jgi:hypothetical protein
MKQNKLIWQKHHIYYSVPEHKQKEETVDILKGEHFICCQLQRRKNVSEGFRKFLKFWLVMNEDNVKKEMLLNSSK